jgi:hypothetical protein
MVIRMYQAAPGVVERTIRKRLKPTSQVMADAAKKSNY